MIKQLRIILQQNIASISFNSSTELKSKFPFSICLHTLAEYCQFLPTFQIYLSEPLEKVEGVCVATDEQVTQPDGVGQGQGVAGQGEG